MFSRREFMKAVMAGGAVIAGELWVPGAKLISIPRELVLPSRPRFLVVGADMLGQRLEGMVDIPRESMTGYIQAGVLNTHRAFARIDHITAMDVKPGDMVTVAPSGEAGHIAYAIAQRRRRMPT